MKNYPQSRDARPNEVEMVLALKGYNYKYQNEKSLRLEKAPCCGHVSHNRCFSINPLNGMFKCFYGSCEKVGNWVTFCRLIGYELPKDDTYVRHEVINFSDTWAMHFKNKERSAVSSNKYPEILNYCLSRGISKETLNAFKISNKWGHSIQVPIFSWHNDEWIRVNARNVKVIGRGNGIGPDNWFEVKGGPTHFLLGNNTLDPTSKDKRCFIFEGQWDMMSAYEIGLRNVFSLPNGAQNVQVGSMLQYIPHDWQVYICSDMDAGGNECAEKFFTQIGGDKFRRLFLPYKDLNEWLVKDPSLTAEMVLETAQGFNVMQKEQSAMYGDFLDEEIEEEKPVIDSPWSQLTNYLDGGAYRGQVTSILAASGSGKTTIVNQWALYAASKNVKTGLISLEDTFSRLCKKLRLVAIGLENGTTLGRKNLKFTQIKGQETTHEELIVQVDKMILDGCEFIVVDNINFLTGRSDEQLSTFRKLIRIAKERAVHIIIVTQPNKVQSGSSVTSSVQKGFSDLYQGTYNHININMDEKDDTIRVIHLEKCRNKWPGSKACVNVRYDDSCNIYKQINSDTDKNYNIPISLALIK